MVFNAAGLLAVAEVIFRPHLLVPKLVVEGASYAKHTLCVSATARNLTNSATSHVDIRALKLDKLKARGVVGVVLDKDNCLTKPYHDALVQELREVWPSLIKTFGRKNVLIVSNSAGTRDDAGFLQAESVSRHLGVPVLLHSTKKPGCTKTVQEYFQDRQSHPSVDHKGKGRANLDQIALDIAAASTFSSETPASPSTSTSPDTSTSTIAAPEIDSEKPKILVIGDRVMTDVVLANRMNKKPWRKTDNTFEAVSILTTRLWQREGLGTRCMRVIETFSMRRAAKYYSKRQKEPVISWQDCVVLPPPALIAPVPVPKARQAIRRPIYQYFSKEHLRSGLRDATRAVYRLLLRLLAPFARRIEPFLSEARQAQFGFRIPEGYKRTKMLRDVLDGRQPISTKK